MKKNLLVLIPALALLLGGCNKTDNPSTSSEGGSDVSSETVDVVESVSINPTSSTLDIGDTLQINAAVSPNTVSDRTIEWSSSNETVATVSSSGRVTAVAAGTAKIKAASHADPTKYAECEITVNAETVQILMTTPVVDTAYKLGTYQANLESWIYFDGTVDSGPRLNTTDLWAESVDVYFENSTTEGEYYLYHMVDDTKTYIGIVEGDYHVSNLTTPYSWKWNAEEHTVYFTDAEKGDMMLMAYKEFTTLSTSTVSYASTSFVGRFYTRMEAVPATGVTVSPATVDIYPGMTQQLECVFAPVNGVGEVKWSSNNEKVTVSETGLVTVSAEAEVNSTAVITATVTVKGSDTPLTATSTFTIKEKLNYGTLEAPLTVAEAVTLIDKCGGTTPQEMYITGIVSENSVYSTQYNNFSYINLTNADGSEKVAFQLFQIAAGEGTGFETTYAEANSLVGKKVVASGIGTYYATKDLYETTGKGVAKLLKVEEGNVTPTSMTLSADTLTLNKGDVSSKITATFAPYGATATVTWTSSDEAVATVSDGVVTAVSAGKATITASVDGLESKTVAVTVTSADGYTFSTADYATANSIKSGTQVKTITSENGDVTLTATGGANTGKVYIGTDISEWRFYKSESGTLTVSVKEGLTLVSVTAVIGKANYAATTETVTLEISENTASLNAATLGSNFQVREITVLYE